jgi:hypothetical protein
LQSSNPISARYEEWPIIASMVNCGLSFRSMHHSANLADFHAQGFFKGRC